ncbi:MAG: hypothetical protein P0Y65_02020 [Candidatus Devosia phytovorans]|uniref:Uncharacterized protein n=1 Tax=Candidatus Devosia phytovorans TaxID=3121372 RepID=A0AAJ5VUF1_9HYPH|nr:hypothetical protein [Devosia sp.]WEK05053.1 MAG: hypothetical protein P0Y65_02020 [Devosia sp.]
MVLRSLVLTAILGLVPFIPAHAQDAGNAELVGELMAFHGSRVIVSAMTTHCYETTGLDGAYKTAYDNWYLRNIGFLDLADRVVTRLGGAQNGEKQAAETYGGTQIMSAYNQAEDKDVFCRGFLAQVQDGALDIDQQLPEALARAQEVASQ